MTILLFVLTAFIAISLAAGLSVPLARALGLPQPVLLAALGLGYGIATSIFGLELGGGALDSYDMWFVDQLALDSTALLTVLLPPLLFEMTLAVDVRRLLDDAATVLVMAILAVVAATAAVGLALWGASDIGLLACLLLGAAVATTDPAAVITTFREIGAPRRLLVILEGESLLNDAAAIAVFSILIGLMAGTAEPTVPGVLAGFGWSFGAGVFAGLGVAGIAGLLYPRLARSSVAEAAVTVAVAYSAYLIAEHQLAASGVVAVVFAGLATGSGAFVRMGPGNWTRVRAVWDQIGFFANAIILVLAASLVPGLLRDLGWDQAWLVAVVYLGALVARASILFGVLPLLAMARVGQPVGARQRLLVLWGGVRGGVTLVLALSIADLGLLGEDARVLAALAAAYTVLTLLLNASTLRLATRLLGLDRLSASDRALRDRIVEGSVERVKGVVSEIARARDLDPDAARELADAFGRSGEAPGGPPAHIPFAECLRAGLTIICGREARLVRRAFEEGAIGPRATTMLRLDAERVADAARTGGRVGYERAMVAAVRPPWAYRAAVWLHRRLGLDRPLRAQIELQFTRLLETERILAELRGFAAGPLGPMIGAEAATNIEAVLAARERLVSEELAAIGEQYPDYAHDLERILLARAAIRRERQQFRQLFNDGVIGPELHAALERELDDREAAATPPPRLDLSLSPADLVARVPLFEGLDGAQRARLARLLRARYTVPGEEILADGARGREMFFIASGAVQLRRGAAVEVLGSGDVFGERAILRPHTRRRSSAVSMAYCRLLVLTRRDFAALAAEDRALGALIRERGEASLREGRGAASD